MAEPTSQAIAKVAIIGSGFSGLGMGIRLKQDGIEDFVILEKAKDVGGTWRDNTYPGCACDIQSHMYSFSFEQNPDWSRSYSPQPEIWEYLRGVARKHDLYRHMRYGVEVKTARWDEERSFWRIYDAEGTEYRAQFLVSGIGALHIPNVPALPGIERFEGTAFHSAEWDHDFDLRGKKVAVVGTGASAVQFVPQIAPEVAKLELFQRTPPWIMPKGDYDMPGWARQAFKRIPFAQTLYRDFLYWINEMRAIGFNGQSWLMRLAEQVARKHMAASIKDRELRRKLTPDYTMGCKRVLKSNDYYPALNRDNVDVITDGIAEVREHSVVDSAGVEHEVDAIIYGTGFHVTDSLEYLDVIGREGQRLDKTWQENGIQTHNGIAVAGFPNLFFLLGPNTGLGHNSVVFMIEQQMRYVGEAIQLVDKGKAGAIEVRKSVQDRFNQDVQQQLENGVWSTGGCTSWYLDSKGVNRTVWPGFTFNYWRRTRRIAPAEFALLGRSPQLTQDEDLVKAG
ncbi:flavin-containing monooxygenase [Sciscionella sediminilitoris]|uniref:flavin-containing monooxygenase n=1 Tax=Sciscionella sediminilitoris TaxID=1445613 RepID=UPI0004DF20A2|nr:NAD(P)/FAD-dependent oxidoreductase [Sciscionella sp. SE31]